MSAVEVRDNPDRHRFEAEVSGHLAVAVYKLDPGVIKPVGPTDFVGVIMPMRI